MEELSCRCAACFELELSCVDVVSLGGGSCLCSRLCVARALSLGLERSLPFVLGDVLVGCVPIPPKRLAPEVSALFPGGGVLPKIVDAPNDADPPTDDDSPNGADLRAELNRLAVRIKGSSAEWDLSSGVFSLRSSSICSSGTVSGRILGAFGRLEALLGDINVLFEGFLPLSLSPILGLLADGDSPGDFLLPDFGELLLGVRIEWPCRGD